MYYCPILKSENCEKTKSIYEKFCFNDEVIICFWSYRIVMSTMVATDHMGYSISVGIGIESSWNQLWIK